MCALDAFKVVFVKVLGPCGAYVGQRRDKFGHFWDYFGLSWVHFRVIFGPLLGLAKHYLDDF